MAVAVVCIFARCTLVDTAGAVMFDDSRFARVAIEELGAVTAVVTAATAITRTSAFEHSFGTLRLAGPVSALN